MKKKLSKLWRSSLALLLAMSLVMGSSGTVFAAGTVSEAGAESIPAEEINYVSLGDSMVNGYGLDGYEYEYHKGESEMIECTESTCSKEHVVFKWSNGYLQEAPDSYPVKLAEYFGWDLTQLAMSAMRVEDLHWILELDYNDSEALTVATMSEWNEESWNATFTNGDYFTWDQFATGRLNKVYPGSNVKSVAQNYQDSIADADVISLGIGNGNFGVFMLGRIMEAIGFDGNPDETMVYNVESAIRNLDADFQAEILSMIDALYAEAEAMGITIDDGDDATTSMMEGLMNTVSYVMVSYVINYRGVIDAIVELNPDAKIIIVGLMNTMEGMKFNINGEIVDFGELMGASLGIVSAYMAALPTVLQAAGEYAEATFYYAEAANVDVMVNNYADEIANGNVTVRDRFITEIVGDNGDGMVWGLLNGLTLQNDTTKDDNPYVVITREEIESYERWPNSSTDKESSKLAYAKDYPEKAKSIAVYLAFEKAVIAASDPDDDGEEPILSLESIMNLGNLGSIFDDVFMAYEEKVKSMISANEELSGISKIDENAATLLATPDAMSAALQSDETVFGLLNLFARCLIGDGLGAHPSAAGHQELFEAIKTAYEDGYTAQEETIANATKLVEAIAAYIAENYEEIYATVYAEAKNAGYIDTATAAIDSAIATLNSIDLSDSQMTDAFKAEVAGEIKEIVETLVAAKALIVEADLLDQASLDALIAMLDEAGEATANLLNLLNQAGVDVTELVIIPALEEAKAKLENEVIPAVKTAVEEIASAAYDYLLEVLADTYDELVDLLVEAAKEYLPEVADAIYDYLYNNPEEVIAFVSEYGPYVVEALEEYGNEVLAVLGYVLYNYGDEIAAFVIENHETILAAMVDWAEVHGENTIALIQVYAEALGLCDAVEEKIAELEAMLEELKAQLENTSEELKAEIEEKIAEVETAIEELKAQLEALKDAIAEMVTEVKTQVDAIVDEIKAKIEEIETTIKTQIEEIKAAATELKAAIESAVDEAVAEIVDEILAVIEENINDLEALAEELAAKLEELVDETVAALIAAWEAAVEEATRGDYVVDKDSYYVALGDGSALSPSYVDLLAAELGLSERYENLAEEGLTVEAALNNIAAYAESIAKADLVTVGFNNNTLVNYMVVQMFNYMMGEAVDTPDWTVYVGEEGIPYVEEALANVYAELVAQGLNRDLMGTNLADALMVAIENYAYAYVEQVASYPALISAIHEISPDALVVLVGMYNGLNGVVVDIEGNEIELGQYVQDLVDAANLESLLYAIIVDDTVYVDAPEVETVATVADATKVNLMKFILGGESVRDELFAALNPSVNGHEYIYDQIMNALNVTYAFLLGDADSNGVVDMFDASLVLEYYVDNEIDYIDLNAGDVDGNGIVDMFDASLILEYYVDNITEFPAAD